MKGLPKFIKARKYEKICDGWVLHQKYRFIKSDNIFAFHRVDNYWVLHWYGPWKSNEMGTHYFLVDGTAYNRCFEQYGRRSLQLKKDTIVESELKPLEELDNLTTDYSNDIVDNLNNSMEELNDLELKKKRRKIYHFQKA